MEYDIKKESGPKISPNDAQDGLVYEKMVKEAYILEKALKEKPEFYVILEEYWNRKIEMMNAELYNDDKDEEAKGNDEQLVNLKVKLKLVALIKGLIKLPDDIIADGEAAWNELKNNEAHEMIVKRINSEIEKDVFLKR